MSGPAGPSQRYLDGATPGLLDPSQPSRVLRLPDSKLSFASFDPRAASASAPELEKLSLNEELYRPKRVVIETLPNGRNYWRFVPRARWAEGVQGEGEWPREISICGETLRCTLDQWDIYKLDPEYDCYVPVAPAIPTIVRKETLAPSGASQSSVDSSSSSSAAPHSKRRISSPPTEIDDGAVPQSKRRKHDVIYVRSDTEDEEEDEVEEMMVDPSARRGRAGTKTHVPSRRTRDKLDAQKKARQASVARAEAKLAKNGFTQDAVMEETPDEIPVPVTPRMGTKPMPPPSTGKRKGPRRSSPERSPREEEIETFKPSKRARTRSPDTIRRETTDKLKERERRRAEQFSRRFTARKEHRERLFMEEILAEAPEPQPANHDADTATPPEMDEEQQRLAAIAESRRKLAELEKDRELWERAARERAARERAEEEKWRAEAERRRRAEQEKQARLEREQRAAQEQQRRAEAEAAARAEAQRRRERWGRGPWTPQRALERYRALCDAFDRTAFGADAPLTFESVPWPVLHSPLVLTLEDVDWGAVEAFFQAVRPHLRAQDYRVLVEKSHRRFHPDRWSARRLLQTVGDEVERNSLEVAANTVAQALTPLWREARGK